MNGLKWPTKKLESQDLKLGELEKILDSLKDLVGKNCKCHQRLSKTLFSEVDVEENFKKSLLNPFPEKDKIRINKKFQRLNETQTLTFMLSVILKNLQFTFDEEKSQKELKELEGIVGKLIEYMAEG